MKLADLRARLTKVRPRCMCMVRDQPLEDGQFEFGTHHERHCPMRTEICVCQSFPEYLYPVAIEARSRRGPHHDRSCPSFDEEHECSCGMVENPDPPFFHTEECWRWEAGQRRTEHEAIEPMDGTEFGRLKRRT